MESQVDITNLRRVIHKIQSEQRVDSIENVAKGMFAIALVLCLLIFSNLLISAADVAKYLLLFFNGVIIAVFLNTLGVLIHESQHGALTNTKFWNNFWGRAFSAFLIFPYFTGKKFHLEHHRFEREREKDPENLFHDKSFWHAFLTGHNEYTRIHWVRMFNYIKQSKNINDKKEAIIDLIWCLGGVAFFIFFVLTLELNPIHAFVPAIIAGPLVFSFRYMTDHFGMEGKPASLEEGYRKPISRIIRTTPLLEWLWCHINYHQVHHHFPQIAHSLLPETYIKTKDLVSYQVEDGYIQVLKKIHNSRYYELNQRSIS